MKTLNNEKELFEYLQSIAKKSLAEAANVLYEKSPDSYVSRFKNELEKEMSNFGLNEQEDEEDEDEGEDEEVEAEDEDAEAEPAEKEVKQEKEKSKNPAAEKALSFIADYEEGIDASFQNIVTALNILRAGKSTKNKEIKTELNDYYERLSEDERKVLLLYLNELAKVLTGAIDGDDAQDPSDPSTYFDIILRKEEDKQKKIQQAQQKAQLQKSTQPTEKKPAVKQDKGAEDVTPPIRVNERQDMTGLRVIQG